MLQEFDQPFVVDRVKEAFDISIQNPVHLFADDRHMQRIERIMLATTRPKTIAETEKVLLVDALQNPQHRFLNDLVLERRNAQWSLAAIRFRYPHSARRLSTVGSPVNSIVEVRNVGLQGLLLVMPGHFVDSDCRRLLQIEERFGQTVLIDVM